VKFDDVPVNRANRLNGQQPEDDRAETATLRFAVMGSRSVVLGVYVRNINEARRPQATSF
jgi:hypothetical protein